MRRLFPCLEPVGYLISRTTPPGGAFLGATGGSHGAVAQLGERYNGIVEVRGSIPLGSTSFQNPRPGAGGFALGGLRLAENLPMFYARASSNSSSEERRVGKECVSKCRSRWAP